ncbi:hypothetical protein GTO89_08925 [Heliobacterium gestii]|uniref:ATP synthase subunit I n=1 Tax=Heliomicrobium gestii TaxID=2699 RepID=A0A845LAB6_HELGE|nr:ATP synthase subunit I [Heliomicrobium gestii]MBM7866562.1 hypothetical protein [Heliomicrobium gestii]MZP43158.1 hypothetical protein [Heliomicrobium gestii]
MQLQRLLSKVWRSGLLGVGISLALIPFVDRPELPAGFALGWFSGILASWLLAMRLRRLENQSPEKAARSIQLSALARFSLGLLALLLAFKTPGEFDLLTTGLGLLMTPVASTVIGWWESRNPYYWEK